MCAAALLVGLLCLSGVWVPAQTPQLPGTPAGRQFGRWLEAFNRGEKQELAAFFKEHYPTSQRSLDDEVEFRQMSGGFDLKKVAESEPARITGVVQGRDTGNYVRFELKVEAEAPHHIASFSLRRIPRPPDIPGPARLSEEEALAALRQEIERRVSRDRFSGAVLVARDGKLVFSGTYGLADREQKTPNRLDTRFRLGSMNKMFTAVAVAQLVQAGRVKLDDPFGKYISGYPNQEMADKVTVRHLLTHTGGTGDIFGPEFEQNRDKLRKLDDYVALYGTRALEFEPGSRWSYSNYGFILLGVIVERVSGQNYYDYVREHIYKPAGMGRSDSLAEDEEVDDRAVGYTREGGALAPNAGTLPYRGTSAGGGYSTVEDLLRFANALTGNKLLNAELVRQVTTGSVETPMGSKYGFGFMDIRSGGAHFFGHGGGAPGMNGELRIFPESGYVVVTLANLDPPAAIYLADFISDRLPLPAEK
jgi:CubicO group peptidase (beta-lactamase class C family)